MPLEFKNALKNTLESYECTWNFPDAKKGIHRALKGLKKQVIALKAATSSIFYDRYPDVQFQWNGSLEWIKKKIDHCEQWGEFPDKKVKNFLNRLNFLSKDWAQNLNALSELKDCSAENSKILETIHFDFTENKEQALELFKEIEENIQRLKAQIELQDPILKNLKNDIDHTKKLLENKIHGFEDPIELHDPLMKLENDSDKTKKLLDNLILRIKKTLPEYGFLAELDESFKKDDEQLEQYEALKNAWLESLIKFKSLEVQIEKSLFDFTTMPIISAFSKNLQIQNLFFDNLINHLEGFSVSTLAAGFVEKYKMLAPSAELLPKEAQYSYKRSLDEFLYKIAAYKMSLSKFSENDEALVNLNLYNNKNLPVVKDVLSKISELVHEINTSTEKESLNFVNEKMKNELLAQKNNSLALLNDFLSKLENSWNLCCLNLNEINFQKRSFLTFKRISEKMGWCHLMAENMQSTIRNLRITENLRSVHPAIFNQECQTFKTLCKIILQDNGTLANENIKILDLPDSFYDDDKPNHDYVERLFPTNPLHSLKNEYDTVMSQKEAIDPFNKDEIFLVEDICSQHVIGNIGLIWSSEKKQEEVFEAFNKQKTAFEDELKKRQEKIYVAFTDTLPKICEITTKELNREGETLSFTKDPYFDDHFTEAYYAEGRAAKTLQTVGSYAAQAIKWTGQTVFKKVNEKLGYQIGYHSQYPNEELPMATETYEFTPLKNPFDEMKQSI